MNKSKCCNSTYHTNSPENVTRYYICDECNKACDLDETNNYIEEIKSIGKYLGCNEDELVSEISILLNKALQKQQDIFKECLPIVEESIEMDGSAIFNRGRLEYKDEFLDNLKKRGINLK